MLPIAWALVSKEIQMEPCVSSRTFWLKLETAMVVGRVWLRGWFYPALEADQVDEPEVQVPVPPAEGRARRGRTAAVETSENDITHYYVVWTVRGTDLGSTIYFATRARGWSSLVAQLPNQAYSPGVSRLRRAECLVDAVVLYNSERERHGCEQYPRIRQC